MCTVEVMRWKKYYLQLLMVVALLIAAKAVSKVQPMSTLLRKDNIDRRDARKRPNGSFFNQLKSFGFKCCCHTHGGLSRQTDKGSCDFSTAAHVSTITRLGKETSWC